MGRASRQRPAHLAVKLREVRQRLNLSQNGMIMRMGLRDKLTRAEISAFERGIRQPPLGVLLKYARAAAGTIEAGSGGGDYLEILIDDSLNLPREFPSNQKSKKSQQVSPPPSKGVPCPDKLSRKRQKES